MTERAMTPPWMWAPGAAWPGMAPWFGVPWGPDMGRMAFHAYLHQLAMLLRHIESTYILDEALHAWHVQVLRQHPELAKDPAMEKFGQHALQALHAKVAAAGLIRRILAGEAPQEAMAILPEVARTFFSEWRHTVTHFREILARPQYAELPGVRAMRHYMTLAHQTVRAYAPWLATTFGVQVEPMPAEPWEVPM